MEKENAKKEGGGIQKPIHSFINSSYVSLPLGCLFLVGVFSWGVCFRTCLIMIMRLCFRCHVTFGQVSFVNSAEMNYPICQYFDDVDSVGAA
jgi:hypothetical protein